MSSPTYAYRAQTVEGQPVTGTIDADDADQARQRLELLRLRVLDLAPAGESKAAGALRGEDFLAFNEQLAHLTAAGLPMEQGLRLIAQDLRRGRVANTVRQIASDLEKGEPLARAFEKHAGRFPPAYARLVDAGVKTNNLSGMLLSLGRHLQTVARMRAALWRALSYPVMVFLALCFVVAFISVYIIPKFEEIFRDFGTRLPAITVLLIKGSRFMAVGAIVAAVLTIAFLILAQVLRATGRDAPLRDAVGLRLPLVAPVLRRSLVSRWCDAVRIGVTGGMDLPAAFRTAADAVGSPRLARHANALAARIESGRPLSEDDAGDRGNLVPATVVAAIDLASRQNALPDTLGTLADMYQQQARAKVGLIPAVLTPLLLAVLTLMVGFIVLALFAPFITLIQALSGGGI